MKIKKCIMFLVLCVMSALCFTQAQEQALRGKHAELQLACSMCHGNDVPTKRAPASACMTCHGEYAAVAALTAEVTPNPHDSHQGELRCTLCHKSHEPSILYCNECHSFDLQME